MWILFHHCFLAFSKKNKLHNYTFYGKKWRMLLMIKKSTKLIVFEENHAGKESLPTYPMLFVFVTYDQ